jgi:glyoxalase family protein
VRLDGIHHVSAITADAPGNVDFYARVLGLRLVKTTVNYDAPDVYHLYYGDERGTPGSIITFFEYPGAAAGRSGAGMCHRIAWRVASADALAFWERRLTAERVTCQRLGSVLRFRDHEGLAHELQLDDSSDAPLSARTPGIPEECALRGLAGLTALVRNPAASAAVLTGTLGFEADGDQAFAVRGSSRLGRYAIEQSAALGLQRAGTVHHAAFCCGDGDQEQWRLALTVAGLNPTQIYDRQYFRSVYFREPGGVLFELVTPSPGFTADEELEHLGEELRLPPQYEALRPTLERSLRPLPNPRAPEGVLP